MDKEEENVADLPEKTIIVTGTRTQAENAKKEIECRDCYLPRFGQAKAFDFEIFRAEARRRSQLGRTQQAPVHQGRFQYPRL